MALACAAAAGNAAAQPWDSDSGVPSVDWRGRLELKRINTSRGTPEETTRTALRVETFFDGAVSLLRVDLPFPDADTDSAAARSTRAWGTSRSGPASARSSPARCVFRLSSSSPCRAPTPRRSAPASTSSAPASACWRRQGAARRVARDAVRGRGVADGFLPWRRRSRRRQLHQARAHAVRPVARAVHAQAQAEAGVRSAKHEQGGVGEIELGAYFGEKHGSQRQWRAWLMLGARLDGPDNVASTYNTRARARPGAYFLTTPSSSPPPSAWASPAPAPSRWRAPGYRTR